MSGTDLRCFRSPSSILSNFLRHPRPLPLELKCRFRYWNHVFKFAVNGMLDRVKALLSFHSRWRHLRVDDIDPVRQLGI